MKVEYEDLSKKKTNLRNVGIFALALAIAGGVWYSQSNDVNEYNQKNISKNSSRMEKQVKHSTNTVALYTDSTVILKENQSNSAERVSESTKANISLVDAVKAGKPLNLTVAGFKRQLLLSPKNVFGKNAKIRCTNGEVLLDPSKDVHVFFGGVADIGQTNVPAEAVGAVKLAKNENQIVPYSGMTATELLRSFDANRSNMTIINDQMVMALKNENQDRILIRQNPDSGSLEMRYEPHIMHALAFGTCQAEVWEEKYGIKHGDELGADYVPTIDEEIKSQQYIDEMIAANDGVVPDNMDVWMPLDGAVILPEEGYHESPDEQAVVTTTGLDPNSGINSGSTGDPVPYGEKYHKSLRQCMWIANIEPALFADPNNPTPQDIASTLCRVLIAIEENNEIFERNMAFNMLVADMTVRTYDDELWATDTKGDTIAWDWRGGENVFARGRLKSWGGGGGALGRNFGISVWTTGLAHEIGHVLGVGHTNKTPIRDLMLEFPRICGQSVKPRIS